MDAKKGRDLKRRLIGTVVWLVIFQAGFWLYWWLVPAEDRSLLVVALIGALAAGVSALYERRARPDSPSAGAET